MSEVASRPSPSALPDRQDLVRSALAERPDGVIEAIARQCGVPSQMVLEALPADQRVFTPAETFDAVWNELTAWGEVLFVVHTPDIVAEIVGTLPSGKHGHGYFNIHGDSAIGGHIRATHCRAIYAVDRPFHGKRSCSVQFYNAEGEAMFKVFVRRDATGALISAQLTRFEALSRSFQQKEPG